MKWYWDLLLQAYLSELNKNTSMIEKNNMQRNLRYI